MKRWMRIFTLSLFTLLILLATTPDPFASAAGTIYVDVEATGAGTGASWTDAYTSLQDGLAAATSGDQVWVAEGIYYPDVGSGVTDNDRSESFHLVDGVEVYGGFAGTEGSLGERDWETNITVLSGDIDQNDTTDPDGIVTDIADISGNNTYHVVTGDSMSSSAMLNGFVLTAGYADGIDTQLSGAGIYAASGSPTLTHVIISGNYALNYGAGMFNNVDCSPVLTDVEFIHNEAAVHGGGMYNSESTPILNQVTFDGNQAGSGYTGGGMYNDASEATLVDVVFLGNQGGAAGGAAEANGSNSSYTNVIFKGNESIFNGGGLFIQQSNAQLYNVLFSGNLAGGYGGGIFVGTSSPTFIYVTASGNRANYGGGIFSSNSSPDLRSSILWNNDAGNSGDQFYNMTGSPIFFDSDIQGSGGSTSWDTTLGTDGGGNLDVDPLFITPVNPAIAPTTSGDLHLPITSPVVEMGDDSICPPTDLDGISRPQGAHCDMGVYEVPANNPADLLLSLHRSPASILKGSSASGQNQWFARTALSDQDGDAGLAFHYVVWLHVPEDWTLPWATQYSFSGDFMSTPLTPDWSAQGWVQDVKNCAFGGAADPGFKWRAFRGSQEVLPPLGNRLDNRVNLRGGLGVPIGETPAVYGGVRVIIGTYYDFNPDGTPDRYTCDGVAVTAIAVP